MPGWERTHRVCLAPGGVQREWSHPIGMKTKPKRRTGLAGVWAQDVAAGIMASSSGSATEPAHRGETFAGESLFWSETSRFPSYLFYCVRGLFGVPAAARTSLFSTLLSMWRI